MRCVATGIPDVLILEPRIHSDDRGFFFESYHERAFREATGLDVAFVQDNHSRSVRKVLRGLHYQIRQAQGKLVRVVVGSVFDVAVDLRESSPTFGRWVGIELSADNRRQVWIPEGFAHGFLVVSDVADLLYKATNYYAPEWERSIRWDDAGLAIEWPLEGSEPLISAKDAASGSFGTAELFG